eukprot:gene365-689_t
MGKTLLEAPEHMKSALKDPSKASADTPGASSSMGKKRVSVKEPSLSVKSKHVSEDEEDGEDGEDEEDEEEEDEEDLGSDEEDGSEEDEAGTGTDLDSDDEESDIDAEKFSEEFGVANQDGVPNTGIDKEALVPTPAPPSPAAQPAAAEGSLATEVVTETVTEGPQAASTSHDAKAETLKTLSEIVGPPMTLQRNFPEYVTQHDSSQRTVLMTIFREHALRNLQKCCQDPRDSRMNEDLLLEVVMRSPGSAAAKTYSPVYTPYEQDENPEDVSAWPDMLPVKVIRMSMEDPEGNHAFKHFRAAIFPTKQVRARSFQLDQVASELVVVREDLDVVRYSSTNSRLVKLYHIARESVDEVRTYFFDADESRCFFTACQFALILDCVSTDPTDTCRGILDKQFLLTRVEQMGKKQAELEANRVRVASARKRVDFDAVRDTIQACMKDSTVKKATLVEKWSSAGRVSRFINTPAGGGKTYIAAEVVHVLLGVKKMLHTLAGLSTWASSIFNRASNGVTVEESDDCMDIDVTWIDTSTEQQLKSSKSLITLCTKTMLRDVLEALNGKSFLSLVIDDPLPVVGEPLKPTCRHVFFLSANSTEFVSELAALGRPHVYADLLSADMQLAEKRAFHIRDGLCLPQTGSLNKAAIDEQLSRMRGNVVKQAHCVMTGAFFRWMIDEMADLTPQTVLKFPLMDPFENKIARSFFSADKKHQGLVPSFEAAGITVKGNAIFCNDGVTLASSEQISRLLEHRYLISKTRCSKKPRTQPGTSEAGASAAPPPPEARLDKVDYLLGPNADYLFSGHLEMITSEPPPSQGKKGRAVKKPTQTPIYKMTVQPQEETRSVVRLSEIQPAIARLPDDADGQFGLRLAAVRDTVSRRLHQNYTLLCTRCGWAFDEDTFLVRMCRARFQCMVCANCAEASQFAFSDPSVVKFDPAVFKTELNAILDTELHGDDLQAVIASCGASWKAATAEEDYEIASFRALFLLLGALVRDSPKRKRILLYVEDAVRPSLKLMTTLLCEFFGVQTREYAEQAVKDSYLASLLEPDAPTPGQSKKRKATKKDDLDQKLSKMSTNLAWFNTPSVEAKALLLSSDTNTSQQEIYGFDARRADCTIFVNFPVNRTQAVARGLRMSPKPVKEHLVIHM